MAKNANKVEKRDVLAELLGDSGGKSKARLTELMGDAPEKKVIKKAKVPAKPVKARVPDRSVAKPIQKDEDDDASTAKSVKKATAKTVAPRQGSVSYKPDAKIKVLRERETRAGTQAEKCWILVKKSKTIGEYIANRKKAGLGDTIGGWLPNFIRNQYVSVR